MGKLSKANDLAGEFDKLLGVNYDEQPDGVARTTGEGYVALPLDAARRVLAMARHSATAAITAMTRRLAADLEDSRRFQFGLDEQQAAHLNAQEQLLESLIETLVEKQRERIRAREVSGPACKHKWMTLIVDDTDVEVCAECGGPRHLLAKGGK